MNRLGRTGFMLLMVMLAGMLLTACGGSPAGEVVVTGSTNAETNAETVMVARPAAPAAEDEGFRVDSYTQVANTDRPQLIEVWEYNCTVCNRIKPMVHRLEAAYWNKIDFVYLHQYDEDNFPTFDRYDMVYRPVFVLIAPDGTLITKWFGEMPEDDIRKILDDYLASV